MFDKLLSIKHSIALPVKFFVGIIVLLMTPHDVTPELARLSVTSASFDNGGTIPERFTCDGADISPDLSWSGTPPEAKSIVVSLDDPDAPRGTWNHWYVYNIPASVSHLPEGISNKQKLPVNSVEAINDFKKRMYGGPCPPSGQHRYVFRVLALDMTLRQTNLSRREVEQHIQGHVIGEGHLLGTYRSRAHQGAPTTP